jgi:hypothetical protein
MTEVCYELGSNQYSWKVAILFFADFCTNYLRLRRSSCTPFYDEAKGIAAVCEFLPSYWMYKP